MTSQCACCAQRVKRKLEKDRDLEGIDLSNIITEGGGRPRRAAAAQAQMNYRCVTPFLRTTDQWAVQVLRF